MKNRKFSLFLVCLTMIYLMVPVVFTILYSFAEGWQASFLPEGWTFKHYWSLFNNPRFLKAILRSIFVSTASIALSFVLLLPVIYAGRMHFKWLDRVMRLLSMVPFAISGVILAVGLTKIYASGPLVLSGSVYLLMGAYFVVIMPFMYQGIKTSFDNLNIEDLIQAGQLLGASELKTFFRVILPNVLKGVSVSVLLSFALLMGEFVLANILVGGNYETIQVFMFWSRGVSGHYSSAIVTSYFLLIVMVSTGIFVLNTSKAKE